MSDRAIVRYFYHSGFSIALRELLLVFDYWRGLDHDIPEETEILEEQLKNYEQVIVFISHSHPDHLDPVVFGWNKAGNVTYVAGNDVTLPVPGVVMNPGDEREIIPGVKVRAFDSTDAGVSFLVDTQGWRFFHAGDLNFWHWRDESNYKEIEEAEAAFQAAMAPIIALEGRMDLAFFPVDARQGNMFEAGANYFIMSVKPRFLLPMHFWGRSDLMESFARQGKTWETQVIPLVHPGDQLILLREEGRYVGQVISAPVVKRRAAEEDDPFSMTDLPVDLS